MQIVIDIPEEIYNSACATNNIWDMRMAGFVCSAIAKGTPLPKGHGRLIDESDLIPDSDYEDGMFYAVSIGAINGAPTIIEADKGETEQVGNLDRLEGE